MKLAYISGDIVGKRATIAHLAWARSGSGLLQTCREVFTKSTTSYTTGRLLLTPPEFHRYMVSARFVWNCNKTVSCLQSSSLLRLSQVYRRILAELPENRLNGLVRSPLVKKPATRYKLPKFISWSLLSIHFSIWSYFSIAILICWECQ
jgi:hypothetical protein